MNEEQKKEAIKKLFDVVVKPTDSDSWLDEARAYHEEVRTFAKNAPTLTDPEKKKFFDKFLYKKNGTAGLGQSASLVKKIGQISKRQPKFSQVSLDYFARRTLMKIRQGTFALKCGRIIMPLLKIESLQPLSIARLLLCCLSL